MSQFLAIFINIRRFLMVEFFGHPDLIQSPTIRIDFLVSM